MKGKKSTYTDSKIYKIYKNLQKRQQTIDNLRLFQHYIKMEYQKIANLLGTTSDNVPRFITKKWMEVYDQSGGSYNINKKIRFKTSLLRSDLSNYSDTYVVAKGAIIIKGIDNRDIKKQVFSI